MNTFYKPYVNNSVRAIIYPMLGIEDIIQPSRELIDDHIDKVISSNKFEVGAYHIILVWADRHDLMTDIWIYKSLESVATGYTVDCKTFRDITETKGEGLTASDGLIMLGRETELEESIRKAGGTIQDYLNADRPILPGDLISEKSID